MAASAQLLLDALSSPNLSASYESGEQSSSPSGESGRLDGSCCCDGSGRFDGISGPDSGLEGSGSFSFTEPPLTSEPPLADGAPLTSEVPITAELPLTSEPTAAGLGTESMEV